MFQQYSFALLLALYAVATAVPLESERDACPPGYWCQKKRDIDSSTCPSEFHCSPSANKRDEVETAESCPPGYWCRKRGDIIFDETDADACPPGYWCSRKREACPPGYWCSRRSLNDADAYCPPGYWCRDEAENTENGNCPSETLCKKESDVIHEETAEEECPENKWCRKRRSVEY